MRIHWLKRASRNLLELELYIAQENPRAAIQVSLKILEAIELLREQPALGRCGRVFGVRELVIVGTPYIVPYRVKKDCIYILRVFHGAMRWPMNLD